MLIFQKQCNSICSELLLRKVGLAGGFGNVFARLSEIGQNKKYEWRIHRLEKIF